jgi:DNA-binding NarL/FixJ family response regulator
MAQAASRVPLSPSLWATSWREERTRLAEHRAVFVTVPPLLSELIAEVVSQQIDLKLIARLGEGDVLTERLPALAPDLVIIGLRRGETDEIGPLALGLVPNAKVLVISNDGRCAYLHEMRPHRKVFFDFSPTNLLAALAGAESSAPG